MECECLLVVTGRAPNVENIGLEAANVTYEAGKGILVNDLSQSVSNSNVYGVGDCVAGVHRLTHQSGEMAKQVVQNSLFGDSWTLSDFVTPAVMYTEPEYAIVGIASAEAAALRGIAVDVSRGGLEHNDRAILESDNYGFCKVICEADTDKILGATIIDLAGISRNIHEYSTTAEALMSAGIQYINSKWKRLD